MLVGLQGRFQFDPTASCSTPMSNPANLLDSLDEGAVIRLDAALRIDEEEGSAESTAAGEILVPAELHGCREA